ncbi:hypothetical protein Tco_1500142 [Tanacetum coccineum]
MTPLPPRALRNLWLRYQVKGYTEDIVHDFEQRLDMIFGRHVNRVHVLDFAGLTDEMRQVLTMSMRMVYTGNEGQELFTSHASMEHTFKLMDTVPPSPYDSPLTGGYIPGSDEGRLKLKELMAIYTKLSKQGRESDKTKSMFQDSDFDVLDDDMEDVEGETVHTTTTGVSTVSTPVTTAGKEEKAKEKGVVIKDVKDSPRPIRSITTLQPLPTIDPKDKGLAQIESDAELAQRLHEEELAEADGSSKNYKIFSEMLDDFDRQDMIDLHRPYLRPNEKMKIWKNQRLQLDKLGDRLSHVVFHVLVDEYWSCIHMMIEKGLSSNSRNCFHRMLNQKNKGDYESGNGTLSFSDLQNHNFRSRRVFRYILLMIKMLILNKLDD